MILTSGGGLLRNDELNLQSIPLLWMEREAVGAGLHLERSSIGNWHVKDLKFKPYNSLSAFSPWRVLEYIPIHRELPKEPWRSTWYVIPCFPHFNPNWYLIGRLIEGKAASYIQTKKYTRRSRFRRRATSRKRAFMSLTQGLPAQRPTNGVTLWERGKLGNSAMWMSGVIF